MQTEKTFLDDLARLATGAFGALGDVKEEVEARVRAQLERILARMNLPTREELDAVKALAAAARAEADALSARVAALEGAKRASRRSPPGRASPPPRRTAPKKSPRP